MDIVCATWQVLKNYTEQGRMGRVTVHDRHQMKGNHLTCLLSIGQQPVSGTSTLWGTG